MIIHDSTELGIALRERRKELGLTQVDAAQLSGVSPRLWSECEQGKRLQVGFETILRMLQTVGADLHVSPRGRAQATSAGR